VLISRPSANDYGAVLNWLILIGRGVALAGRGQQRAPDHRPVSDSSTGRIVAITEVGGLHHRYERRAA
jgi:hypothetical protein